MCLQFGNSRAMRRPEAFQAGIDSLLFPELRIHASTYSYIVARGSKSKEHDFTVLKSSVALMPPGRGVGGGYVAV